MTKAIDLDIFLEPSAIDAALHGDLDPLIVLLREGRPLSPETMYVIADCLEGKHRRPRGRRRKLGWERALLDPDGEAVRRAAYYVKVVKGEQRRKGNNYGAHDQIVEAVFNWLSSKGFDVPDRERLENYLKRPKSKR